MSAYFCNVCGLTDLPEAVNIEWKKKVRKRSTRSKKVDSEEELETKWIECSSCKLWLHPFCVGFSEEEFGRIQGKFFYKCITCCLLKFEDKVSKCNYKDLVKNKISSVSSVREESIRNKVIDNLSADEKSPLETTTSESSTDKKESEVVESNVGQIVDKKVEIALNSENEVEARGKIIVIDEISNPSDFSKSANILKEIKRYSDINIDFTYPLVKGGIAIHTQSKEERDQLFEQLPIDSFSGGKKSKLEENRPKSAFIKNIDTKVSTSEIETKLRTQDINVIECKRIINWTTQRPTRTVKVTVSLEDIEKLIRNFEFKVGDSSCKIERQKYSSVIRCYDCQQFGHIGKNCKAEKRCVRCAGNHISHLLCSLPAKCVNCEGEHSSADNKCQVYIRYNEIATK